MADRPLPHHHGTKEENHILREDLARTEDFQTVSDVFRLLADPTRTRIFWLLCHCEECVINISAMMEMSSPAVSHHLRALRGSRLIVSRRVGKEVYYRASDLPQSQLLHQMIEEIMAITCPDGAPEEPHAPEETCTSESLPKAAETKNTLSEYAPEQIGAVRRIHAQMLTQMERHFTIDELSREYLMNPTTLKTVFKAVYGDSIAAHIRRHRMERAAALLRETRESVCEIARAVGYGNQSKFTAAFKEYYGVLPTAYRKEQAERRDLRES